MDHVLLEGSAAIGGITCVDGFVGRAHVAALTHDATRMRAYARRKHVPGYKRSESVGWRQLAESAPAIAALYRSEALRAALSALAGVSLVRCPDDDAHACALYYYTQMGDHIGWHYDRSHYAGARYTALIGLVDRSSSRLMCRVAGGAGGAPRELHIRTSPGRLLFFDGDRLHHAVSPLGEGEERVVLSMELVTDPRISRAGRIVSRLKDATTYFGLREVLAR
jgi:hypothetical protein